MSEFFKLVSTYDVILTFSTNTRPVRIEVLRSTENPNKYRARVWDQNTYNLYPTFANLDNEGGNENQMYSCDEVNREITTIMSADDPNELIYGQEWPSEDAFLERVKELVEKYHSDLG